jgi:hydroxypyruvate isomerase
MSMDLSVYLNAVFDGDYEDRLDRIAAVGADAVDVGTWGFDDPVAVAAAAEERGLDVAYLSGPVGNTNEPDAVDERVAEAEAALGLAEECGVGLLNVSPGPVVEDADDAEQFAACVEVLRRTAGAAADAGVNLLLEPLNPVVDHPDAWLTTAVQGCQLLAGVDHSNPGLLFDIYHEQVATGNVLDTFRRHVEDVDHVHVAGVPGRGAPVGGELDYAAVFDALDDAGYDGYVGCEFAPAEGTDPEAAVEDVAALL